MIGSKSKCNYARALTAACREARMAMCRRLLLRPVPQAPLDRICHSQNTTSDEVQFLTMPLSIHMFHSNHLFPQTEDRPCAQFPEYASTPWQVIAGTHGPFLSQTRLRGLSTPMRASWDRGSRSNRRRLPRDRIRPRPEATLSVYCPDSRSMQFVALCRRRLTGTNGTSFDGG